MELISMNPEEARNEIAELTAQIRRHEKLYRLQNAPEISDIEFDKMMHRLKELEETFPQFAQANSPTRKVGSDLESGFEEFEHLAPMQSLDNVFNLDELRAFDNRLRRALAITPANGGEHEQKLRYCVEPKIDGAGISAIYENGKLVRLLTRGDGKKGNDISTNAFLIRNLPLELKGRFPKMLEVRGECYMTVAEFERIRKRQLEIENLKAERSNKKRQAKLSIEAGNAEPDNAIESPKAKDQGYANPRNLAAGTMKLLPKTFDENPELKQRRLLSVFYSLGTVEGFELDRQSELPKYLSQWGLPSVDWHALADGVDEAYKQILHFENIRSQLPYNTDGAVLKLDDVSMHALAGATDKAPRWAIAWKYAAEQKKTRLNSITIQVGRTGVVTPVAELEPVRISGTTVSRATLHNAGYIEQKDIRVGDMVVVEKAGEIIPAVVEVDLSSRPKNSEKYKFPTHCPDCGSELKRFGEKMLYRCPNFTCPPQVRGRLIHFASRNCMDVDGLGDKMTEFLVDNFNVKSPADFYELDAEKLLSCDKFVDEKTKKLSKTGTNLLKAIEDSKSRPLWRLIFGLGILEIGAQFAKELSKRFGCMDAVMNAPLEEITSIEGFGSKAAKDAQSVRALSIRAFFDDSHNRETIERLRQFGLNFKDDSADESLKQIFAAKTFVITGKLDSMERPKAQSLIEKLGGKNLSAVSANTDYLIASDDASGAKINKARQLGIKILGESEFINLLKEAGLPDSEIGSVSAGQNQERGVENERNGKGGSAKSSGATAANDSQLSLF